VYSGSATESTKELVDLVASTTAISARKKTTLKSIGQITKKIQTSLENGIFPFQLIQKNQRLLEGLGVVSLTAQKIISKIESIGGVAKITGAGGVKTGSGYLLAAHLDGEILENFLQSQKWEFFSIF
jgi:mevalonate kinase